MYFVALKLQNLAVIVTLFTSTAYSKTYCRQDNECAYLGELICVKSICEWGVCGCPRKKASKYLGEKEKFKCVEIKKVGERCSNDDDEGVCGADHSYCDEESNKCKCDPGMVAIWGGERCASIRSSSVGETCSSTSAIGNCQVDNSVCTSTGSYYHRPTAYDVPTCSCPNTQYLGLSNAYVELRTISSIIPFVHNIQPQCVPIAHSDPCMLSSDCRTGMQCNPTTFLCECSTSGHVPSYDRMTCALALTFGALCASPATGYHCDGSQGLTCGDMCAVTGTNELTDSTRTCICGPYHLLSGTTCVAIGSGGTCNGDMNCKGWKLSGVCVDNTCVDGTAATKAATLLTSILPLFVLMLLTN